MDGVKIIYKVFILLKVCYDQNQGWGQLHAKVIN